MTMGRPQTLAILVVVGLALAMHACLNVVPA